PGSVSPFLILILIWSSSAPPRLTSRFTRVSDFSHGFNAPFPAALAFLRSVPGRVRRHLVLRVLHPFARRLAPARRTLHRDQPAHRHALLRPACQGGHRQL